MTPSVLSGHSWRIGVDDGVVALSPSTDGRIAVAGAEGSLTLVSVDGLIEDRRSVSPGCLAIAWSPAGHRLAVGSVNGVDVLDRAGAVVASRRGGWCSSVAWSADGSRLAAAVGRAVTVLDSDGGEVFSCSRESTVTAVAWVNHRVASAAYGGVHVQHATRSAAPDVLPFVGSLLALAVSPDRRWAASGNQDATLHVWRMGRDDEQLSMSGYARKVTALSFSPDSKMLASGGGADATVWDFTGRGPRGSTPRILRGGDGVVTAIGWAADAALVAASSSAGDVAVWNARAAVPGRPAAPLDAVDRPAPATALCWDPLGRLVAGWSDGVVLAHVVGGG
ncbi:WD40 repeat domain-containing protein [Mycolicibacterium sp. CBM1]